jgi:hypothetical protein
MTLEPELEKAKTLSNAVVKLEKYRAVKMQEAEQVPPISPSVGEGLLEKRVSRGKDWSGRRDLNSGPPAPKAGALPGCATPRQTNPPILLYYLGLVPVRAIANLCLVRCAGLCGFDFPR